MSETDTAVEAETTDPAVTEPAEPATPAEPETVTLPKAEADALRRQVAEAEKRARKLENDQKKAEEARLAKEGQFEELARTREQELVAERGERARAEREQRITRIAGRLKFVDPSDVIGRVTADEGQEDTTAEAALQRIAEQSPHLIAKDPPARPEIGQVHTPSQTPDAGPTPPPGKAPLRTQADVEALSDAEFNARYAEVKAVLASTQ